MIKKIKYIMIFMSVIFMIMIFPNKVNASTIVLDRTEFYESTNFRFNDNYDYSIELNHIVNYLESNYTQYSVFVYGSTTNGIFNKFSYFYIMIGKDTTVTDYYLDYSSGLFRGNFFLVRDNSTGSSIDESFDTTSSVNYLKEHYIDNNINFSVKDRPNGISPMVGISDFILYSSKNMNWYSYGDYCLKVRDNYYTNTDSITNYLEFQNNIRTSYDEIIDTSIYSSVEFTFNTPITLPIDVINLNYSIMSVDDMDQISSIVFDIPYFKYNGKDTYIDNTVKYGIRTSSFEHLVKNNYSGSIGVNSSTFVSDLKLIVPFDLLNNGYVHISFSSGLSYSVNYISRDDTINNYSSIDITGKYGVVFKPKQTVDSFQSIFKFGIDSQYFVQVRDNFSENNDDYKIITAYSLGYCDNIDYTGVTPISCSDTYNLSIPSYWLNKKQIVYVHNKNYTDSNINSIVYYDNRYYTAYIQDTAITYVTITDLETDETYILGSMLNYDEKYFDDSKESFLSMFKSAFDEFKQDIKNFLTDISTFWSSSSIILKRFFIVIFTLILTIFIIQVIL